MSVKAVRELWKSTYLPRPTESDSLRVGIRVLCGPLRLEVDGGLPGLAVLVLPALPVLVETDVSGPSSWVA